MNPSKPPNEKSFFKRVLFAQNAAAGTVARKKDIGIVGALVMLSQAVSNFQSTSSLKDEILKLKVEFAQAQLDREVHFAKKTDIVSLSKKVDKVGRQVTQLTLNMNTLQKYVRRSLVLGEFNKVTACETHDVLKEMRL